MAKRVRNYKREYARRLERARLLGFSKSQGRGHPKKGEKKIGRLTKDQIKDIVSKDAKQVFGRKPKRLKGEQLPIDYEIKLADKQKREGRFEWTDEATFIGDMQALGLTEREAYTQWFSP